LDNNALIESIRRLGPWHHDIELNDEVHTGKVFSPTGTLPKGENDGVTLISPRKQFTNLVKGVYSDSMLEGKTFLDCACNGGGYCFLAREFGATNVVGFDVREHWINQAKFAIEHRKTAPVDNIKFDVMDLYDLPKQELQPFDFTYFSGIFYHLPDPITGLKIAADLTKDVLFISTAGTSVPGNPTGMSMSRESTTRVMSGVYEMSWFPNGPECIQALLNWLGFKEVKLVRLVENPNNRIRMSIVAAREEGRLEHAPGELMPPVSVTTNRKKS
jgi:2-polyprenyl-3-methyl-5-hydroxy-6-metoxy-1,4-benzoquinol methylase